jgi:hypothetical protein
MFRAATEAPQAGPAVPVAGLAVEIAAQMRAGKNRFEIRLDPPELGRIDVRLDVDKDGNVTSRLMVERSDTLDLLRRDAHQLERALNQAGLKTADNALEFSLRDHGSNRDKRRRPRRGEAHYSRRRGTGSRGRARLWPPARLRERPRHPRLKDGYHGHHQSRRRQQRSLGDRQRHGRIREFVECDRRHQGIRWRAISRPSFSC